MLLLPGEPKHGQFTDWPGFGELLALLSGMHLVRQLGPPGMRETQKFQAGSIEDAIRVIEALQLLLTPGGGSGGWAATMVAIISNAAAHAAFVDCIA
jgi:hypothetical protein